MQPLKRTGRRCHCSMREAGALPDSIIRISLKDDLLALAPKGRQEVLSMNEVRVSQQQQAQVVVPSAECWEHAKVKGENSPDARFLNACYSMPATDSRQAPCRMKMVCALESIQVACRCCFHIYFWTCSPSTSPGWRTP